MKRRAFNRLISGATFAAPLTARAQQSVMPVIGFLNSASPALNSDRLRAFRQGLGEVGYVEGTSLAIEYRWAEGQYDRLPMLAADLIDHHVRVIVTTGGSPSARAAKMATATIPVVFYVSSVDPVAIGLVDRLDRPGGNLTGVTTSAGDPGPKQLELLHEFVPAASSFAVLVNPTNSAAAIAMQIEHMQTVARSSGLQTQILRAGTDSDFDTVFASLPQLGIGGLVILPDPFYFSRSEQLGALTLRHRIPAIYQYREFTAAGGLASYGNSLTDPYRLLGVYTGRILRGEQPADLPVQQSAKIEFFINRRTASMIGFDVPPKLLALAYEIME